MEPYLKKSKRRSRVIEGLWTGPGAKAHLSAAELWP